MADQWFGEEGGSVTIRKFYRRIRAFGGISLPSTISVSFDCKPLSTMIKLAQKTEALGGRMTNGVCLDAIVGSDVLSRFLLRGMLG